MLVPTFRSLSVSSVVVRWSLRTAHCQHLWLHFTGPVSPSASLVSLARRHSNIHSVALKCTMSSYPVRITFGINSGKKECVNFSCLYHIHGTFSCQLPTDSLQPKGYTLETNRPTLNQAMFTTLDHWCIQQTWTNNGTANVYHRGPA